MTTTKVGKKREVQHTHTHGHPPCIKQVPGPLRLPHATYYFIHDHSHTMFPLPECLILQYLPNGTHSSGTLFRQQFPPQTDPQLLPQSSSILQEYPLSTANLALKKKKIGPHHAACGIELVPPALLRQSFNQWIAREVPILALLELHFGIVERWLQWSGSFWIPSHETIQSN